MTVSHSRPRALVAQPRLLRFDSAEQKPRKPIAPNVREVSIRLWACLVSSAQTLDTVAETLRPGLSACDLRRMRDYYALAAGADSFATDLDFAHEDSPLYERPTLLAANVLAAFATLNSMSVRDTWRGFYRQARVHKKQSDFLTAATVFLAQSGCRSV